MSRRLTRVVHAAAAASLAITTMGSAVACVAAGAALIAAPAAAIASSPAATVVAANQAAIERETIAACVGRHRDGRSRGLIGRHCRRGR